MNFDYTDEQKALQDEARRLLREAGGLRGARDALEGRSATGVALWQQIAGLGWLGAALPRRYGGLELGYATLAAIAEELGRSLAPVPAVSSIFLAAEMLLRGGTETQKSALLPELASGRRIATLALAEGPGALSESHITATVRELRLTGHKRVTDGMAAGLAVVAAREARSGVGFYLVDLDSDGVSRAPLESLDPSSPWAALSFAGAKVEPLGAEPAGWTVFERTLQTAAVLTAFMQVGGADVCLEMARGYALERWAFGRPIGQYQAVKHRLVDIYSANELARSCAYAGAQALDTDPASLPLAAATARVAASDAFEQAARDNMQTHGGIAATWAHDAHLFYRRSRHLAVLLGATNEWRDRIATQLEQRLSA